MVDDLNGAPRTRAWPKPRGPNRSPVNKYWTDWLRGVTFLWRYQPANFQDQLTRATQGTPWMARDPFISATRGRAWSFSDQNGRTWYPMPAKEAVSQSLDTVGQLPGQMLYRGDLLWQATEPPPGEGYELVSAEPGAPPIWLPRNDPSPGYDAWSPITPPVTAHTDDDEFRLPGSGAPTGWTERDYPGNLVVDVDDAGLRLKQPSAAGLQNAGITKAIPTGDLYIATRVALSSYPQGSIQAGLALWEDPTSSTGDLATIVVHSASNQMQVIAQRFNAYNSFAATLATTSVVGSPIPAMFLRLTRVGTDWFFYVSSDGLAWTYFHGGALPFTPTAVGPMLNNQVSGIDAVARFNFVRFKADATQFGALLDGQRL